MFVSVAALAILLLVVGWIYLSSQVTKVVLSSDQTVYFPNDKIKVDVSIENYKDANEVAVVVEYPANAVLIDSKTETGVTTRSLENAVVFEADSSFTAGKNTKLGTLTFDSKENGEFVFKIERELTKLGSQKGDIEIKEFVDLSVSVGVPSDSEGKTEKSEKSSLEI